MTASIASIGDYDEDSDTYAVTILLTTAEVDKMDLKEGDEVELTKEGVE